MALTKITLTGTRDLIKAAFTKVNDIIDDLLSTSSGLGASTIGIEDSASNMAADNVEDALAEIYTDVTNPRTAWDTLDENSTTTTGLTWGYNGGLLRVDNTIVTVTAGTISLTDDDTNYVEIQTNGTVSRNTSAFTAGRIPLRLVVCSSGAQDTSTDKRAWFQGQTVPLTVAKGGSGIATLTDHGILIGSGTSAITPLAAATNGQLPIGKTSNDPTLATLTATANETTVANGAGSITLGIADDIVVPTSITVPNEGFYILEPGGSPTHTLLIRGNSILSDDRYLIFTTGDASRIIILSGNPTLDDWFDQAVKTGSSPTFTTVTVGGTALAATGAEINKAADGIVYAPITGDATAGRVIRQSQLKISDATTASEIKVELVGAWNGHTITEQDDLGKGETAGNFTLDADGYYLKIETAGLSGNCIAVLSVDITLNNKGTAVTCWYNVSANDPQFRFYELDGSAVDLTAFVDTGKSIYIHITYITSS